MSKFLKIFAPAGAGAASALTMAYVLADQFIVEVPAPLRGAIVQPAHADETAPPEPVKTAAIVSPNGGFGLGRAALPEEIAAWDIDVRPDGVGLPEGSGDVWTGEEVFVEKCASCHGDFGEAVGRWPVLAGGHDTLSDEDPVKTIGSYWPYLSTVFDYVNRAMPFGEAQSLEPDEIYAITAYLLYVNDLVEDDFTLSHENFVEMQLPNQDNFFMDDRAETEFPLFVGADVCMENCKGSVEITMRATVLDVTPDDGSDDTPTEPAAAVEATPEVEETPTEQAEVEQAVIPIPPPEEMVEAGEKAFRQCKACHQVGDGAQNRTGPHLNGVLGRTIGGVDGFRYSRTFDAARDAGDVWTEENLSAFLADPRGVMNGTKMAFRGVRKEEDITALMFYLRSFGTE